MKDKPKQTKTYKNSTSPEIIRGIKNWPKDERPREKLLRDGEHRLSDTELLAILLRSGVKGESAIDLARKILEIRGHNTNFFFLTRE